MLVSIVTVEIGSLGHWIQSSQRSICQAIPSISKRNAKEILDSAAAKVISASEQDWKHPGLPLGLY